jgi:hypothetical protein
MKVKNTTKKTTISKSAVLYTSLFKKAQGLMFSRQRDLIFAEEEERYIPLHMWFVFYQLDVLYLNKKKQLVEIKENFRPFTFYYPQKKAQYVLELKHRAVKPSKTALNDFLEFR